jgi:hypothetical protein
VHWRNAESATASSLEPGSVVRVDRRVHFLKHFGAIVLTDEGMQMLVSDEQFANKASLKRESFDPDSKVTAESSTQSEKQ